jgi:hypothetical protein
MPILVTLKAMPPKSLFSPSLSNSFHSFNPEPSQKSCDK